MKISLRRGHIIKKEELSRTLSLQTKQENVCEDCLVYRRYLHFELTTVMQKRRGPIRVAYPDPGSGVFLNPGSGSEMEKKPDPG